MCRQRVLLLLLVSSCPLLLLALADDLVLLFPKSTVFQFTVGMSVPIAMDKKGGIVFSSGFQFNYALPWNLTQFEPLVVQARSPRQASSSSGDGVQQLNLENIYTSLEDMLEKHGWEDGRECLLRTICELAGSPLARSGEDVVEEIIHLLLTRPSEDSREADYSSQWSGSKLYEKAERVGIDAGADSCAAVYAGCAESPLDYFTEIAFR